ncbi:MAG TPA: TolC family protein [Opitutaceae bacterium]
MRNSAAALLAVAAFCGCVPGSLAAPLTLSQAIDTVLARYPSIDAAKAAIDASRARTMQSNAVRMPQVTGQAGYTYNSLRPYVAFDIPGRPPGAFYENISDSYGITVTARQLLTDFGRTDRLVDMARSGQITAQDALEETRHQLGYQTIEAFYGVLLLRSSTDVAREEISALEEALRIAQKKFSAGSATKFDVLTTEVRLSNAHNRLADTIASLEKQENALRQLLGVDVGAPLEITGSFDANAPAIPESVAISDGLLNRPEMKLARDDEQTSLLSRDAADRGNRPSLSAQVTGGVQDGFVPNLYDNKGFVTAGLSLEVPILTGNRVEGDRMAASAGVRSAKAKEHELAETITTDVADAYADLNAARARLGNADTLVQQAAEALSLAQTRYTNGVITNFELLDAQSSSRAAELTRLQARYDCVLARQAVARAAGVAPQP